MVNLSRQRLFVLAGWLGFVDLVGLDRDRGRRSLAGDCEGGDVYDYCCVYDSKERRR